MREYKFRAWLTAHKKIVDVDEIYFKRNKILFKDNDLPIPLYSLKFELMQYTGLKDKNGKEIYEGDIVNADYEECNKVYQVIFYNCGYKMKGINCSTVYDYSIHDNHPTFEIIGNIYENPELLEVEE